MVKKILIGAAAVALIAIGVWYVVSGEENGKSNRFGKSTGMTVTSIEEIQKNPEKYLNQVVTIDGKITRECPETGCWWYVQDKTGEMRVDSKRGGFSLPLKHAGHMIRATGIAVKTESGELQIAASGAELR
jgi:Domain of unknown function (DUF4920)